MSRYDQKYKPYCPKCRTLKSGILDRVQANPIKFNVRSVRYKCNRCGYQWLTRAKFAQRELGRKRRANE